MIEITLCETPFPCKLRLHLPSRLSPPQVWKYIVRCAASAMLPTWAQWLRTIYNSYTHTVWTPSDQMKQTMIVFSHVLFYQCFLVKNLFQIISWHYMTTHVAFWHKRFFKKLLVCIVCTSNVDTHCAQIQMEKIPTHQHHPTHPIHFCCMPGGAYSQEGWLQNMCNFAQTEIWVLIKHYVCESRFNVCWLKYCW